MGIIISFILILGLLFSATVDSTTSDEDVLVVSIFNVLDYGAISGYNVDNSQAFLEAWNAACNAETESPAVLVPEETIFLVNPVTFTGPCKAEEVHFLISGTIVAPSSPSIWSGQDASLWLAFKNVRGLNVEGSGTIYGQGKGWWDQSCRYHPELEGCTKLAPTTLKFLSCSEGRLSNLRVVDSPQTHVLMMGCKGFTIDNLVILSPESSPNTDGIHIQSSQDLNITNTKIGSGDDCISVGDYTSNIDIDNVECGPGHGISIGSLGKGGNFVRVENIHVNNSLFTGTTNGARIKTWQRGKGYVRQVLFENIRFRDVKNPIIIDQNYCEVRGACPQLETGVQIANVTYKAITGTSSTDIAINLNCSSFVPCSDIKMQSVQLESAVVGKQVIANCTNAHGKEMDIMPGPCLLDATDR